MRNESQSKDRSRLHTFSEFDDETQPLIPTNILDQAAQRLLVVSLFILLQSFKVRDVLLLKFAFFGGDPSNVLNNFTFVLKYAILDGIFLWSLPILKIEYITFSPFKTLIFTLALNLVTVFLVSDVAATTISSTIGSVLPLFKSVTNRRELTIAGDSISPRNVIDVDSHFKGRYTINYLPDSSAKFNPFHFDKVCLNQGDNTVLQMPIEFNTTTEIGILQLEHTKPSAEKSIITFSKHELAKLLRRDHSHLKKYQGYVESDRIFYVEIPIRDPGHYKITSVKDLKGSSIRTYKSDFIWNFCPAAEFTYPPNFNFNDNYRCSHQNSKTLSFPFISVHGVEPITVKVQAKLSNKIVDTFDYTIQEFNETDTSLYHKLKYSSHARNILEGKFLSGFEKYSKISEGKLEFNLLEVSDYFGNSRKYNPASKDKDVFHVLEFKKSPRIQLQDPNKDHPLVINGTKTLVVGHDNSLKKGDFPMKIDLEYLNPDDDLLSYNFSKTYKDLSELKKGFQVMDSGKYVLRYAEGRYCPCEIVHKEVTVKHREPPAVLIEANPVIDKCLGMTGYDFKFEFEGMAPFRLQYQVYHNTSNGILKPVYDERGLIKRSFYSQKKVNDFKYAPPGEGKYVIVFNSLSDRYYKDNGVALDSTLHTYSTYFKKRSSARFSGIGAGSKILQSCLGDIAKVPIGFSGNFPFSFEYSLVDVESGRKVVKSQQVESSESACIIETPELKKGGMFDVQISNLKDGLACDVDFAGNQGNLKINVRLDTPAISVSSKEQHYKIVEKDYVNIPLNFQSSTGSLPEDSLTYIFTDLHGKQQERKSSTLKFLQVSEAGTYKLKTFNNGPCKGQVLSDNTFTVSYYPRPNITIVPGDTLKQHTEEDGLHLKPVCQNCENRIFLELSGVGPFVIDYEIDLPNGRSEIRTMSTKANSIHVNLSTSQSGTYVHRFKEIYDKFYTREKSSKLKLRPYPTIRYDVNRHPLASFKDPKPLQICEANLLGDFRIPLDLSGSAPYSLDFDLSQIGSKKSQHFFVEDLEEPFVTIDRFSKGLKVGDYSLTIRRVMDANGCVSVSHSPQNSTLISITKVPNMVKSPQRAHYCVGDHISYNVSGIAPFDIFYEFNNKMQKSKSAAKFQRLASRPGNLSIIGVSDSSASQCYVDFSKAPDTYKSLQLEVHNLPSVEIFEGDVYSADLHEGDKVEIKFSFVGTAPFSLTYIRTLEDKNTHHSKYSQSQHRNIVETHTVDNIWEHEYSIMASLEGTYEAIEVRDAFCIAKREFY